jgi:hypothetical protein
MAEVVDVNQFLSQVFQPKLTFQWIVAVDGMDSFLAESIDRPKFDVNEIESGFFNSTQWFAGKVKPSTIQMRFKDAIAPSQTQKAMEWLRLIYEAETGRAGYKALYTKDITLKGLSPTGEVVEKWQLKNCWVKNLSPSSFDYNSEDKMMVDLEIRFDNAILVF